PAYSYQDPRKYALFVFNTILGSGMSSRLFQNLREKKGLAYSIYSFLDFWSDVGLLGIYVGTSQKKSQEAVELIQEELNSLSKNPVSKDELKKTKSQLTRNLILMSDDCTNRMNRLAKMENYILDFIPMEKVVSNIENISEEDVQHVAYELVEKKERYTTILGIE
ncbi:insulinase family protein, partial [bacterium]|nr:insulinase family protein [bacterium]